MKPKVLVMDDDVSICKICSLLLTRLGYEVDTVAEGEAALVLYKQAMEAGAPYVAVILDLTVKAGIGGLETVEKLKAMDPNVHAIMASGSSVDNMISSYRNYGFKDILPKPFRFQDVTDCMQRLNSKAS